MGKLFSISLVLFVFVSEYAVSGEPDWIQAAKSVNAHALDASLPDTDFAIWYSAVTGQSSIEWESNDCGEQDGSGTQADFPICVEARAELPGQGTLSVSMALGSYKKGITGDPVLWIIYIQEDGQIRLLNGMAELKAALAQYAVEK